MKILIKNGNLISMDDKREKYEENIDVLIEDRKIKKIGKNIKLEDNMKVIDAEGKIILPGFINTHAHVSMSIFRDTLDGYTLQDWLEKKIWPMEDKLVNEDIYNASMLSCIEMIKSGTTTINDMYFMAEDTIKAALDTGIRLQTTRTLMSLGNQGDERIAEFEELIKNYNNKYDTITFNIGIHGLYTSTEEYINKYLNLAKKYKMPVNIHYCENENEVENIKKEYKTEPIQVIKKYFKDMHIILAHAVFLSSKDIDELTKLNAYISHCPISNLKLGCGIAKIQEMNEKGITVSLGTDGQGSGSNLDMFENMKFASLLQKGINKNPKDMPAYETLKMATINGAKALGLGQQIGSIAEGKSADIIIIDLEKVFNQPVNDIFSNLVYNAKGYNVDTTIVNGEILMENRKLKIEEKNIYKECSKIIKRINV